ncbi:MAG: THUMP domain-containing protein [Candidatus Hermodarchaeota archaeon]
MIIEKDLNLTLLISSVRTYEREALSEAWQLFKEFGYESKAAISNIPGLSLLTIPKGNLKEIIGIIQSQLTKKIFDYCLKFVPLQKIVPTTLKQIVDTVKELLDENQLILDKWRITLNRRHTTLDRMAILQKVAKVVEHGKVDLKNPSWIIQIEILGKISGISILQPHQIISQGRKEKDEKLFP